MKNIEIMQEAIESVLQTPLCREAESVHELSAYLLFAKRVAQKVNDHGELYMNKLDILSEIAGRVSDMVAEAENK